MIAKFKRNIASWNDFKLFYRVFLLISVLPVLIKWHTLPGLLNHLAPSGREPVEDPSFSDSQKKIVKYTDFILGWGVGVWNRTCLKRSLVLFYFLSRIGMPIQICFGIRIPTDENGQVTPGILEGHAWLEYKNLFFLEVDPDMTRTYKETYRFPESLGTSPCMTPLPVMVQ